MFKLYTQNLNGNHEYLHFAEVESFGENTVKVEMKYVDIVKVDLKDGNMIIEYKRKKEI